MSELHQAMEYNPAYGVVRQTTQDSNLYDYVDPECVQNISYQTPASVQKKPNKNTNGKRRKKNIRIATIVLIAIILALVIVLSAIITVAALYGPVSNSNQEIALETEVENLREMLNETECKFYQLLPLKTIGSSYCSI